MASESDPSSTAPSFPSSLSILSRRPAFLVFAAMMTIMGILAIAVRVALFPDPDINVVGVVIAFLVWIGLVAAGYKLFTGEPNRLTQWILLMVFEASIILLIFTYERNIIISERIVLYLLLPSILAAFVFNSTEYSAFVGGNIILFVGFFLISPAQISSLITPFLQYIVISASLLGFSWYQNQMNHEQDLLIQKEVMRKFEIESLQRIKEASNSLGHDIKNLMQSFYGYFELAKLGKLENKDYDRIDHLMKEGNRLNKRLVELEASTYSNQPSVPIELREFLDKYHSSWTRLLDDGIDFQMQFNISNDVKITFDEFDLNQIIINLLTNANDALLEKGGTDPTIILSVQNIELQDSLNYKNQIFLPQSYIVLEIIDNGSGISEKVMDRIFQPFNTSKGLGSGLGLSHVYNTLQRRESNIFCTTSNSGTCMSLYFPRG